jgi:hypothetical protein
MQARSTSLPRRTREQGWWDTPAARWMLFSIIAVAALGSRWAHLNIVWVDEAYPIAAVVQLLEGKALYRDVWFDKPPLYAWVYLLWRGETGIPLRIAGAAWVMLCSVLSWGIARSWWGSKEAAAAAGLTAFFLIFYVPSAVIPLAPDTLTVPLAQAAVLAVSRGRPGVAGLAAGAAMWVNAKSAYLLLVVWLFQPAAWAWMIGGFALAHAAGIGTLGITGVLAHYWKQVWQWGSMYAADSPYANALSEGVRRTANWVGFHAMLPLAAVRAAMQDRDRITLCLGVWTALAMGSVVLGWRFFPRYYFALLPPLVLWASRGLTSFRRPVAPLLLLLLLMIPLGRFGPRYVELAGDVVRGRAHQWHDLSMHDDAMAAAAFLRGHADSQDTLLVWGYRPEVFAFSRLHAGTPFLDSQPLTGVIADRHLTSSHVSAPEVAQSNRLALLETKPTFIVDGLGPYNADLAISNYPDLAGWLRQYQVAGRTQFSIIYRLRQ